MGQNILIGDKNGIIVWRFQTIIDVFLFWHFKVMLMIPSCAKQLIWMLKISN
jgi:hypothetical protein